MKASRTWLVWAALVICAATILAAMTWQTRNALASERDRLAAESRADLQEKMRLALWRMDTRGATLVIEESNGGPLPFVRSRLDWRETGQLTLPGGKPAPVDLQRAVSQPGISFADCAKILTVGNELWKTEMPPILPPAESKNMPRPEEKSLNYASKAELSKRSKAVDGVYSQNRVKEAAAAAPLDKDDLAAPRQTAKAPAEIPTAESVRSLTRPVWLGDELFLLYTISGRIRSINGSWIDLAALQNLLLAEARDLLPAARLIPAKTPSNDGLVLASFPLRLEPGPLPVYPGSLAAPITLSLIAGWSAAAIAILAASLLVFGIMRLSERRASFVSAVTHELRTPLTTFRLYSDMLETGAVRPEKRGDYLRVLSREADRLSHLVENVLAFSRIERGSARSAVGNVTAADLLEPMRERFEARLASAEMTLAMTFENPAETIRADAAAIEHILFNLVDNAAKYAGTGEPPALEISTARRGHLLEIRVTDHGPGIPASERRRIFRAFHKSAREAAETRPGVGLGLALSRRLARGLGGELDCDSRENRGALFILSLPVSRGSPQGNPLAVKTATPDW